METRIDALAAHRELIPTVASWHFDEWGHADPGGSERAWAEQLAARAQLEGVPSYYLAFADTTPVGSVGLCENDMSTHPELSPWLSGLYVLPKFRRRGVGSLLIDYAMSAARAAGVGTLFLHTASADRLYARQGWKSLGRESYEGETVCVMSVELAA